MPPDLNRVLLRRVIDGMIAGDNPNTKIYYDGMHTAVNSKH